MTALCSFTRSFLCDQVWSAATLDDVRMHLLSWQICFHRFEMYTYVFGLEYAAEIRYPRILPGKANVELGYVRLCKGASEEEWSTVRLRHLPIGEWIPQSRSVPLFVSTVPCEQSSPRSATIARRAEYNCSLSTCHPDLANSSQPEERESPALQMPKQLRGGALTVPPPHFTPPFLSYV
jgi:hypothetical protein